MVAAVGQKNDFSGVNRIGNTRENARRSYRTMLESRILEEKLATLTHKEKMDKIPWENFRENLNIPEEIL